MTRAALVVLLAAAPSSAQDDAAAKSERAATLWARSIEAEFDRRDCCPSIDRAFDLDSLYERTVEPHRNLARFVPEMKKLIEREYRVGEGIFETVRQNGCCRLLRVRTAEGSARALFRVSGGGTMNYVDFLLDASGTDKVRIRDVFGYGAGTWLSESLRRGFLREIGRNDRAYRLLSDADKEKVSRALRAAAFVSFSQTHKAEETFREYDDLEGDLRRDVGILIARYQAGKRESTKLALQALEDLRRHFPRHPSTAFLAVNTPAAEPERVLKTLEDLTEHVGPDAFLEWWRGEIHYARGKYGSAEACYRKAAALEPTLASPLRGLLFLSLREKKFDETVRLLSKLEGEHRERLEGLEKNEVFAEFLASPACLEWLKARHRDDGETHELALRQSMSPGSRTEFWQSRWHGRKFRVESGGKVTRSEDDSEATSFHGVREILEVRDGRVLRERVTFRKAVRRQGGREEPFSFEGTTVTVEPDGEGNRRYRHEKGIEASGDELDTLRRAMGDRKKEKEEPSADEMFAPKKPLKAGETWVPDIAAVTRQMSGGAMKMATGQTRALFQLRSVRKSAEGKFGRIEGTMTCQVAEVSGFRLDRPVALQFSFARELWIDGSSPEGREDTDVSMAGDRDAPSADGVASAKVHLELSGGATVIQKRAP